VSAARAVPQDHQQPGAHRGNKKRAQPGLPQTVYNFDNSKLGEHQQTAQKRLLRHQDRHHRHRGTLPHQLHEDQQVQHPRGRPRLQDRGPPVFLAYEWLLIFIWPMHKSCNLIEIKVDRVQTAHALELQAADRHVPASELTFLYKPVTIVERCQK